VTKLVDGIIKRSEKQIPSTTVQQVRSIIEQKNTQFFILQQDGQQPQSPKAFPVRREELGDMIRKQQL